MGDRRVADVHVRRNCIRDTGVLLYVSKTAVYDVVRRAVRAAADVQFGQAAANEWAGGFAISSDVVEREMNNTCGSATCAMCQ